MSHSEAFFKMNQEFASRSQDVETMQLLSDYMGLSITELQWFIGMALNEQKNETLRAAGTQLLELASNDKGSLAGEYASLILAAEREDSA